ncbi:MAG TPA: tetraacyldisaccharide 4'-kinase [Thermodesulfobacteriota bacterium]
MNGLPRGESPPARLALGAAAALYGAAVRLRGLAYDLGLLPAHRLPAAVASVGNLAVGGAGKTPTTLYLARLLVGQGRRPAILSRGYGGRHARGAGRRGVPLVVGDGGPTPLAGVEEAGDEPVLLARRSGVPVVVCPDRVSAGRLAIERFGADTLVLDDGFQHRRLARDLDLVLVDARTGLATGRLLPAGPLREPPAALARAHVILLTKVPKSGNRDGLLRQIRALAPRAAVFESRYRPTAIGPLGGPAAPLGEASGVLAGRRVVALSGLADPSSFHELLAELGAVEVRPLAFPDHHAYGPADYRRIAEAASAADVVVTTEKDAVKLDLARLGAVTPLVLEVTLDPDDPDGFAAACAARLAAAG